MTSDTRESAAADFVRRFTEFWAATPITHTLEEGKRTFAELFELIPDLTAEVRRWGATADGVLIEFTLSGTAGGRPMSWHAVDRFLLGEDGLATERISYFDSAPIALTVARRPRVWPAFGRVQLRRLRR